MSKLRVTFENPDAGTVWFTLASGSESVAISATYIYNSFYQLADALHRIRAAPGQATVVWMCEPSEYEMQFCREADIIRLEVVWFPGSERSVFKPGQVEMSMTGSYDEVCLPFWRALRELQGRLPASDFEARWGDPFPSRELELLTAVLGK